MKDIIIGIDLGTTNTLAAAVYNNGVEVLHQPNESALTPSVLSFAESGWIVGHDALAFRTLAPQNTVYSVKRLMGRDFSEIQQDLPYLPYRVIPAQRKLVKIQIGERLFTPQEISAEILKKVKAQAERVLGQTVSKAVITVPAYFDDAERQATRDAGRIAGLEVVRILNEPTAAALAYGLDQKKDGYVAVYDLGGGTFDISILSLQGKVFKVVSTSGNTHLGGDDFDHLIAQALIKKIQQQFPSLPLDPNNLITWMKTLAESIKIQLSSALDTPWHWHTPPFADTAGKEIKDVFTRADFNDLIRPLVEQTLSECGKALKDAGLSVGQIDEVVLVGGSSIIPLVRDKVRDFFGRPPHLAIDPYKVVALGAGIQAHLLAGGSREFLLLDVIPLSLGIETLGGTFSKIIMGNTTIPFEASEKFTTHVDQQTAININIFQGERELVKDCRALGQFKLRGIPPMKAGLPLLNVTFRIDANGILHVSALEERSGKVAEIEVIPFHGLTQNEIEKIMEDAIENATEDFNERQLIEFRNTAELVFKGIEQAWVTAESLLSEFQQIAIRKQMQIVREHFSQNDAQKLKQQMDLLGDLTRPLADAAISHAVLNELKKSRPEPQT